MHRLSISQSVIDRVVARRGREHIFDDLNPATTALVVVDMQNGFMLPVLGHAPCKMTHEIVPNINRMAECVRATGSTASSWAPRCRRKPRRRPQATWACCAAIRWRCSPSAATTSAIISVTGSGRAGA